MRSEPAPRPLAKLSESAQRSLAKFSDSAQRSLSKLSESAQRSLSRLYESALRPLLFRLDAERAHEEVSGLLAMLAPVPGAARLLSAVAAAPTGLERTVFGVRFPNPVGLAAGFDKDGRLTTIMPGLGFGFVEIGSVTLEPQRGNPRPRLFRAPESRALINRLGFNSLGARRVARLLSGSRRERRVPLGINLGLNRDTPEAKAPGAYARTFHILAAHGDYFVVNVSSPNTPGLRDLQDARHLTSILNAVQDANAARKPVLLKLAPELAGEELEAAVAVAEKHAQGLVVCNTTTSRAGVDARWRDVEGGLSGAPLKKRANELCHRVRSLTKLPIIGVGGIENGHDARERLKAGADLIQLYTGLIYEGPTVVKRILQGLAPEPA